MPARIGGLVALAAVAAMAVPAVADAAPSRKKAIWGPVRVDGVSQFPIYRDLGAGIYQTDLHWNQVAATRPARPTDPTDPAYRWPAALDYAVREAQRYGIRLSIVISGTPSWANGRDDPDWAPRRPADYGRFARAASSR
jgi:hypothetical protein